MRKLFNRPALALAAVLGLVFLIILIKSYCKLVDQLAISLSQIKENDVNFESEFESVAASSQITSITSGNSGPKLPNYYLRKSVDVRNREITLGTFEALNGTCFLRDGVKYSSFYKTSDKFLDLQDAVNRSKINTNDEDKNIETLMGLANWSYSTDEKNNMTQFYNEINRYHLYSKNTKTVDNLLYDMKTQGIYKVEEKLGDYQFRLRYTLDNDVVVLFKPLRATREEETLPEFPIFFAKYERHTSEIAAFHLDRILDFRRALPVVGRNMNLITEMLIRAPSALQRTFYISPKPAENLCFTGNCGRFCDAYHAICGNGTFLEGCFIVSPPEFEGSGRTARTHPWAIPDLGEFKAPWETDPEYCDKVLNMPLYSEDRILLLELIDMSIFDFLIGNEDRKKFTRFDAFNGNTFTLHHENGRAFGKAFHDELKILAPLLQCCFIRTSTLKMLLEIHNSPIPLSQRMKESMTEEEISPILWPPHLEALDRRVGILLHAVRDCIARYPEEEVLNL